jgi:mono/diheme cytochrome c family protein
MLRTLVLPALLVACGGGGGAAPPPSTPATSTTAAPAAAAPKTLDDQVSAGEKVYGERCASCHGAKGEGKAKAPGLIGPKGLDEYHNAKEAFTYIKDMMPPTAPGSLSEDEYWNVTAYLIKKNDLEIKEPLSAGNAETVKWSR